LDHVLGDAALTFGVLDQRPQVVFGARGRLFQQEIGASSRKRCQYGYGSAMYCGSLKGNSSSMSGVLLFLFPSTLVPA
jgi:hypothetical protein